MPELSLSTPPAALARCMAALLCVGLGACTSGKRHAGRTIVERRVPAAMTKVRAAPSRPLPPGPELAELRRAAADPVHADTAARRVEHMVRHPAVSNAAWHSGRRPAVAENAALGQFVRVASWNIEKSFRFREAAEALASEAAFRRLLKPEVAADPERLAEALRQRERLVSADVLLLQEMDRGMPRSGHDDTAAVIARALGMNHSYALQQIEVDPVTLGMEPGAEPPDPRRYVGGFGLAVLSRWPITGVEAFALREQPYDWYHGEQLRPDFVERLRRFGARLVLGTRIEREMKLGGRILFRTDVHIPGLPGNRLSVVHNHLEIKTTTAGRERQLREILNHVRRLPGAVVMAGDHNSAASDVSPTSLSRLVGRTVKDPEAWLAVAARTVAAAPDVASLVRTALNAAKNLHNPLAFHLPVVLPNRNRGLFRMIEDFRFDDGGRFDARGDAERSINGARGRFANANERYWKGLSPTFRVPRPLGPLGRTRLDWIFVKQPPEWQGTWRFAPHYGETLEQFDVALASPLSDHRPIVADLPLHEPPVAAARQDAGAPSR